VEAGIFALLGAVTGAAIGFGSGWLLERHRWDQARRVAVMAVLLEVSFLAETLESAAKEGVRTRESLQRDWWDRHGPDLVNYLPGHFIKALHVLYYDLDRLQHWYDRFTKHDFVPDELPQMAAMFLGWAYQAQYVADHVNEHNIQRRHLRMPLMGGQGLEDERQESMQFIKDMHQHAIEKLQAEGLSVDETGKVVN
jgi:hypothetical protein